LILLTIGVTLIVGGGYHGKSTLLQAVERGVYNHISRDGREWVVTDPTAVKIRAEDGRRIENVDISSFIHNPPMDKNTVEFKTENASGSTSQAANIVESLEAGTELLLFDEDTSATNFMIRDERMQRLVSKDKEPITPFIDRVQEIYTE
jgi:predicted ABC-class ATPase